MMRRALFRAAGLFLALSLSVTVLAGILWVLGTSETIMLPMIRHFAPSEATLLPDKEYPEMVHMLTRYLAGDMQEFQHRYIADGELIETFQPHEQQHMADCRSLFRLDRKVLYAGALLSAVLFGLGLGERKIFKGCVIGFGLVMAVAAVVAAAAMVDFDKLFVLFHKLSFANDLWLLDPHTDMLIRLMPIGFFTTYALILGVSWFALMGLMLAGAAILYKRGA